jgi:hypothetical protein
MALIKNCIEPQPKPMSPQMLEEETKSAGKGHK